VIAAILGALIWYGSSARARYELSQMTEEEGEQADGVSAGVAESGDE
jgi:hypothetical protein